MSQKRGKEQNFPRARRGVSKRLASSFSTARAQPAPVNFATAVLYERPKCIWMQQRLVDGCECVYSRDEEKRREQQAGKHELGTRRHLQRNFLFPSGGTRLRADSNRSSSLGSTQDYRKSVDRRHTSIRLHSFVRGFSTAMGKKNVAPFSGLTKKERILLDKTRQNNA